MGGHTQKDHTTARGICEALSCGRPGCPCVQAVNRGTGTTHCPAHDDGTPSLSVGLSNDGKPLVHCNAGCTQDAVIDALRSRGLWPDRAAPAKRNAPRKIVAVYDYTDADGTLQYQVVRYDPKEFAVRRSDGGKWIYKLGGIRKVLYMLPELLAAIKAGETVYIVEGEKDADRLHELGLTATTAPFGAGKWPMEFGLHFEGARVVVIPDNDAAGMKHVEGVLKSLDDHARQVVVAYPPDHAKDISEWFDQCGTVEQFKAEIEKKLALVPEPDQVVPIGGPALLRTLETYFSDYAVLGPGVATTLALWTMGTWVWEDAFDTYGYLGITSPVMRCGKSRVMKLLKPVVNRPLSTAGISPAGLFRVVEAEHPVLLIDEAQKLSRRDESNADLYDLLCAGYERGATVTRIGGANRDEVMHFEVYSPKCFALIGKLDDTLADRSITIRMRRRKKTEAIKPFFAIKVKVITGPIKAQLEAWATPELKVRVREEYLKSGSEIMPPAGLDDREADLWFPLLALAEVVDAERYQEIEQIALALSGAKGTEGDAISLRLLNDIRGTWPDEQEFISTTDLLKVLVAVPDAPWSEYRQGKPLSGKGLADLLQPFDILPGRTRLEGYTPGTRGYARRDFESAWETYLDDPDPDGGGETPQSAVTSVTASQTHIEHGESEAPPNGAVTDAMCHKPEEGQPDGERDTCEVSRDTSEQDAESPVIPEFVTDVTDVTDIAGVTGTDGQMDLEGARKWLLSVSESFDFPEAAVYGWAMEGREQWERFAASADRAMIMAVADMFGWADGQGTGYPR